MTTGVLFYSRPSDLGVFFTRSPETAAYFALLERDDDEGRGAILILDRQSLRCKYRVEPWHDDFWDDETGRRDEMEERVWGSVTDVGRHLIGYVTEFMTQSSPATKTRNKARQRDIKARLLPIKPNEARNLLVILHSLEGMKRSVPFPSNIQKKLEGLPGDNFPYHEGAFQSRLSPEQSDNKTPIDTDEHRNIGTFSPCSHIMSNGKPISGGQKTLEMPPDTLQMEADYLPKGEAKVRLLTLGDLDGRKTQYPRTMRRSRPRAGITGAPPPISRHQGLARCCGGFVAPAWRPRCQISIEPYLASVNVLRRLLGTLGLKRRARVVTPRLRDYIAGKLSANDDEVPV